MKKCPCCGFETPETPEEFLAKAREWLYDDPEEALRDKRDRTYRETAEFHAKTACFQEDWAFLDSPGGRKALEQAMRELVRRRRATEATRGNPATEPTPATRQQRQQRQQSFDRPPAG